MPRQARKLSESGYLHVIQRGIGKQLLFETPEDYKYYLRLLECRSREKEVAVCTYCLMENHTHLLLFDKKGKITELMKTIGISYSYYFNQKYERVGHLFQDRYRSEPVESDTSLMRVTRYILNNPMKAGICPAKEYPWSSYHYFGDRSSFVDWSIMESLAGDKNAFAAFIEEKNDDVYLEYDSGCRHDDKWAIEVIHRRLEGRSGTSLQAMNRVERDKMIRLLKAEGLSVRQLERLTGINRGVIQKA
ncbi:MAG: transposase [Eubacteriales bacterium]|nr:transposase [Eubacteriales bacterium]